ncbi:MAG TPA: hypothetical protein VF834_07090 [Streptosporangiaceae bacterium]
MTTAPGATYRATFTKVTSFIIVTQQRRTVHTGTLEQLQAVARSTLIYNLLLGWWGFPFGLVWTPMALARNAKSMRQVRALAAGQSAAGPMPLQ